MGIGVAGVRTKIKNGGLRVVRDEVPTRVHATEVEAHRRESLAKFSDVVDTTDGPPSAAPSGNASANDWARSIAAAQELFDDGEAAMRQALRLLSDTAVRHLGD